tara:strand:+ start:9350 stop:10492 length:1143 start_codon:yes stop_codon:yes gene_type:complete
MKKIFIITERRADFSRFKPIIKLIEKDKSLDYQLVVTGLHLVKKHGYTIKEIQKEKFKILAKFKMFDKNYFFNNDGVAMSDALGVVFKKLPKILKKVKPDLILSGFDIAANFALCVCGAHMNIPVAHIQGGEVSGTIDESLRHAMTKFSNLHFTANLDTKKRLIRMGEFKKNIFTVGCPSIDALYQEKSLKDNLILKKFNINKKNLFLLVLQHPVTSEVNLAKKQMIQTIQAIKMSKIQHLIVFPNSDAGSKDILKIIKKSKMNFTSTLNLSEYRSLLDGNMILVGNSSSGIHEAASFKVPVINIGSRQNGRMKPKNVINIKHHKKDILKAIHKARSFNFKKKIRNIKNPYGDGKSSKKIVKIIKSLNLKNFETQKKISY